MRLLALAAIAVGAALPLAEQEPGMLMAPHMLERERAACELYTESCEALTRAALKARGETCRQYYTFVPAQEALSQPKQRAAVAAHYRRCKLPLAAKACAINMGKSATCETQQMSTALRQVARLYAIATTPNSEKERIGPRERATALEMLAQTLAMQSESARLALLDESGGVGPIVDLLADFDDHVGVGASVSERAARVLVLLPAAELRKVRQQRVLKLLRDPRVPLATVRTGVFDAMLGVHGVSDGGRQALVNAVYATLDDPAVAPEMSADQAFDALTQSLGEEDEDEGFRQGEVDLRFLHLGMDGPARVWVTHLGRKWDFCTGRRPDRMDECGGAVHFSLRNEEAHLHQVTSGAWAGMSGTQVVCAALAVMTKLNSEEHNQRVRRRRLPLMRLPAAGHSWARNAFSARCRS